MRRLFAIALGLTIMLPLIVRRKTTRDWTTGATSVVKAKASCSPAASTACRRTSRATFRSPAPESARAGAPNARRLGDGRHVRRATLSTYRCPFVCGRGRNPALSVGWRRAGALSLLGARSSALAHPGGLSTRTWPEVVPSSCGHTATFGFTLRSRPSPPWRSIASSRSIASTQCPHPRHHCLAMQ